MWLLSGNEILQSFLKFVLHPNQQPLPRTQIIQGNNKERKHTISTIGYYPGPAAIYEKF